MRKLLGVALAALVPFVVAGAQAKAKPDAKKPKAQAQEKDRAKSDHVIHIPGSFEWHDGPPALPSGAEMAVLEGDPTKGGLFTMRLRFPNGYRVPPHHHGADEHVTVISGTLLLGFGDTLTESATTAIPAGGFAMMKRKTRHYAIARGVTTLQVHAMGPWKVTYVRDEDDPRKAAEAEKKAADEKKKADAKKKAEGKK